MLTKERTAYIVALLAAFAACVGTILAAAADAFCRSRP